MSARKIKRLEAGRIERQLAPPKPEITTWAKAGSIAKTRRVQASCASRCG